MAPGNIENVVPGLAAMRAEERQNRALTFAGLTVTVCGLEVRPLTPGHRLALQLTRNAFVVAGTEPLAGDVFEFLWLLSPAYRPPGTKRLFSNLAQSYRQSRMRAFVRRLELKKATREIYAFLVAQMQDAPESSTEPGTDQSVWIHWIAADASFWITRHGGFTLETYKETPYIILQQLYRAWQCNHPSFAADGSSEDPQFINRSDQLIGAWHRENRAAIAARLRNQRERRP